MPDFLEALETYEGTVHGAKNLFTIGREEGSPMRRTITTREYKQKLGSAVKFLTEVMSGKIPTSVLREVMTTSDFPHLFGDILDRTVLATYQEWPSTWQAYAKRATVQDFRDAKLIPPVFGADTILDEVKEGAPYPDATLTEQPHILWHVLKYGRRVPFSWEAIINDDLNQLKDIPVRLARAARRTENRLVAVLFVDASGPHASFFTVGNKNIINPTNGGISSVGANPPLSINALQSAYIVLSNMRDEVGEPIMREALTLVVPPALEVTAENIINATQIWDSSVLGGGQPDNGSTSGERTLITRNWMASKLNVQVDPYLPVIATTNGNTSWYLFANPNYSREAIRIGFLAGHETPEIWMKSPNAVRVGGGAIDPLNGDFDTDAVEYRIRHVTGVTRVDPKAVVASNGSGS